MTRLTRVLLLAVGATVLIGAPLTATPITMTFDTNPSLIYQESAHEPCVIGNPSCTEPAGMTYTNYPGTPLGQGDTYDAYSPTYTYSALVGFLSSQTSFQIGVDENEATGAKLEEILDEFTVWGCDTSQFTCGTYAANQFDPSLATGADATLSAGNYTELYKTNTQYPLDVHNGTGFSDALSSAISINGLSGYSFVFEAKVANDTNGMEQFFLIPAGSPAVPEPASMILLGTGLLGVRAVISRRRRG